MVVHRNRYYDGDYCRIIGSVVRMLTEDAGSVVQDLKRRLAGLVKPSSVQRRSCSKSSCHVQTPITPGPTKCSQPRVRLLPTHSSVHGGKTCLSLLVARDILTNATGSFPPPFTTYSSSETVCPSPIFPSLLHALILPSPHRCLRDLHIRWSLRFRYWL